MSKTYDIVIIGSGLGGLITGNILCRKGFKVAIVEKNPYPGGCLQSFEKDGVTFDTGIHYVGGLKKEQVLYKLFCYLNIFRDLNIREMDVNGFDRFLIGTNEYTYPAGYSKFQEKLESVFPKEKDAIVEYINKIRTIANSVSLYNLKPIDYDPKNFYDKFTHGNAWTFIQSITKNTKLQHLLAAQNSLYAGKPESTFLFVHALITNHYLEGAWRFVDGSRQLADALVNKFTTLGGDIYFSQKAVQFRFHQDSIQSAVTDKKQEFSGKRFISAIHPYHTMEMIEPDKIRRSYRKRLQNLDNTISTFSLYIVFKDGTFPYMNCNCYYYPNGNVWGLSYYDEKKFPQSFGIYPLADSIDKKYTRAISVLAFMDYREVEKWENTTIEMRGEEYEKFKEIKSQKVIAEMERYFPDLRTKIKSYTSATPLTLRDHTGTYRGATYGIERDCRNPNNSLLFPRTKISNLYLTGQNLSLHGMLGVSMGALLTCSEFMDLNRLIEEINHG
ncbi:MAG: NAD(P)/FAD-dependent oxidoreductase [Bacteroidales bacterium]|nr:NAD(P)/FAD-dependent oxidoreductase [Bacteroidales bacterium]